MNQWDTPVEECSKTTPPSSEAITTPVTRTVVDETENFFSAFLSPGDLQTAKSTKVVSVPPTKSSRGGPQEKKAKKEAVVADDVDSPQQSKEVEEHQECKDDVDMDLDLDNEAIHAEPENLSAGPDVVLLELEPAASVALTVPEQTSTSENLTASDTTVMASSEAAPDKPQSSSESELGVDRLESPRAAGPKSPSKAALAPAKEILLESKDTKGEDRQSDTPSPPVSAFSSGTSTTSDIEVLDHESVLSESSASSRQENAEAKAGLHLMQGSFQLLSASACADFPRLGDDYPKLTESCGSSSDAFERIDSFSVQSLDSRSVSEVNSDDEIPGGRTLASVTSASSHASLLVPVQKKVEGEESEEGEDRRHEETMTERSLDETELEMESEMEESGRSATPVNCEQPEEEPESDVTLSGLSADTSEPRTPPITEEMRGASTSQILELQKVCVGGWVGLTFWRLK